MRSLWFVVGVSYDLWRNAFYVAEEVVRVTRWELEKRLRK